MRKVLFAVSLALAVLSHAQSYCADWWKPDAEWALVRAAEKGELHGSKSSYLKSR